MYLSHIARISRAQNFRVYLELDPVRLGAEPELRAVGRYVAVQVERVRGEVDARLLPHVHCDSRGAATTRYSLFRWVIA